jgi:WD40 repeat protein
MKKQLPSTSKPRTMGNIPSIVDFDRFIPSKKSFTNLELTMQEKGAKGESRHSKDFEDIENHPLTISESHSGSHLVGSLLREGIFSSQNLNLNDPFLGRRLYSQEMLGTFEKCRKISKEPFKVLDAPFLQDDFYLNVIDWSQRNMLGVGLGNAVYTWDFLSNNVDKLLELEDDNLVTAVTWGGQGHLMAVGTLKGEVSLWDINKCKSY